MPAGSKMDPLLAKAKPISNSGSTSETIRDTKVNAEGGAGGAPSARAEIPLQPMEKTMVEQISTFSPWRTPHRSRWRHLKEAVTPWEAHAGTSSWQDLWPHGERSRFAVRTCDPMGDPRWSSLLLKVCTPWKGPMLEQFVKNCSPWEGLTLEQFVEDCLPWEGPHAGAEEECEESSPLRRNSRDNV
ncbi:hypothetical protein GRJ2_001076200 [Grus japonensis]|uniref:Uncharacterized protein n=1 Tax=Grus japonensis TaxID=30415 RepID=A0ABC9WKZ2_GRUJA